jgi:hypothetical protein
VEHLMSGEGKQSKRKPTPPSEVLRRMLIISKGSTPAEEGQRELVAANGASLPIKGSDAPYLKKLGFTFGPPLDNVFREASLPLGWSVKADPEYMMWCHIVDTKGRKRVGISYVPDFSNRKAELHAVVRYRLNVEYQGQFGRTGESHRGCVQDQATDTEVFTTKTLRRESEADRSFLKTELLKEECQQWLEKNFPNHLDPLAYWDDL